MAQGDRETDARDQGLPFGKGYQVKEDRDQFTEYTLSHDTDQPGVSSWRLPNTGQVVGVRGGGEGRDPDCVATTQNYEELVNGIGFIHFPGGLQLCSGF